MHPLPGFFMRNILLALAGSMLLSSTAYAGGIGLISTGGLHQEQVYAYDTELTQYKINQPRPIYGLGMQAILGDVDDDFVGVAKIYFLGDSPPNRAGIQASAVSQGWKEADNGELTFATREDMRTMGVATAGLQWTAWGEPTGLAVNVLGNLGASFMTVDSREFLLAEAGVGAHYALSDMLQVNAEAMYRMRYRKGFAHGGGINVGVRYFFD